MVRRRQPESGERLPQLDSIRGIAALFVVFNHYVQIIPERLRPPTSLGELFSITTWASPLTWLRFTPLRLLVDGEAAVDLFFVLSGVVLALPLTQSSQPAMLPFYVKRFCRVYLPFAGVILIVAAAYEVIPTAPSPAVSNWLSSLLVPHGGYSLAAHLLMRGREDDMRLDPVMWTLVHEMRLSLIFRLFSVDSKDRCRLGGRRVPADIILTSFRMSDSIAGDWQATVHFLWMFATGSALSCHRANVVRLMRGLGRRVTLPLWVLTIMLLIVPFDRVWADFLIGGSAALLICLCLDCGRIPDALRWPGFLLLGRVSYSLYLIHLPVLIFAAISGFAGGARVTVFLLTLALSEVTYRLLEQPSQGIGVKLARAIGTTRQ